LLGQAGAAGDFGARHRSIPQQALDHEADGLLPRSGCGGEILHDADPISQEIELIAQVERRQGGFLDPRGVVLCFRLMEFGLVCSHYLQIAQGVLGLSPNDKSQESPT
jgi:hypothetical protein